jgi:hypothetical protein
LPLTKGSYNRLPDAVMDYSIGGFDGKVKRQNLKKNFAFYFGNI